jgi:hypothetical protein
MRRIPTYIRSLRPTASGTRIDRIQSVHAIGFLVFKLCLPSVICKTGYLTDTE